MPGRVEESSQVVMYLLSADIFWKTLKKGQNIISNHYYEAKETPTCIKV